MIIVLQMSTCFDVIVHFCLPLVQYRLTHHPIEWDAKFKFTFKVVMISYLLSHLCNFLY